MGEPGSAPHHHACDFLELDGSTLSLAYEATLHLILR